MKMKLATAAAVLCTAAPSMAFLKIESKSTVNKDGSAKFLTSLEFDLSGVMALMQQPGQNPLEGKEKEMLTGMIKSMQGTVDVWSDAKVEKVKGGGTRVTVSGFTKDWRAMGDLKKALAASPQASEIPLADLPELKFMDMKNDAAGNTVITMAGLDDFANLVDAGRKYAIKEGKAPKAGDMKVDEAEIAQGLTQARAAWPQIKGIAGPMLKGLSVKSEIQVSGSITSAEVFEKTSADTATFTFTGDQLISLADQIITDEDLPGKVVALAGAIEANFDNEKSTLAVKNFVEPYLKTIYGGAANPKIVIKPGADAFDYTAETEKAKASQSAELKALIAAAGKEGSVKLPESAPKKK